MSFLNAIIHRPAGTLLASLAIIFAGLLCYRLLPVAALPRIDIPTISVTASLPGASPEMMANTVTTPLIQELSAVPAIREISATNLSESSSITLEFALDRDIDLAAVDVQAALARAQRRLPAEMPSPPVLRKINLADAPVPLLVLRSDVNPLSRLDALARTVVSPRLTAVRGVGQVSINGGQKYAVRIQLDPYDLTARRIGVEEVERAVRAANPSTSLGALNGSAQRLSIQAPSQLGDADAWRDLIIANRNGRPIRLGDVAEVSDSVEDHQHASRYNGSPALVVAVQRQPDANLVDVVDGIRAALPSIKQELGPEISIAAVSDRSLSIRTAVGDLTQTLVFTVLIVCAVIYLCVGRLTTTLVPAVTIPVCIVATFAAMYVLGLSLDNITLLALTLSVGLVVDDAIVVNDNVLRRMQGGSPPIEAALQGVREVSFTVVSITASLVAVFIPLLFMEGVVGRILNSFAITVSIALVISALVSLSLTPVLAARLPLRCGPTYSQRNMSEKAFEWLSRRYGTCLDACFRVRPLMVVMLLASILTSGWMFRVIPKGFLPQEDTGQIVVSTRARQDVSFQAMVDLQGRVETVLRNSPHVAHVVSEIGATASSGLNEGRLTIELKGRTERPGLPEALADIRRDLDGVPGIESLVTTTQNARMGSQASRGSYQLLVQASTVDELKYWATRLAAVMAQDATFVAVRADTGDLTLQATINVDYDKANQLGVTSEHLRSTLHTGFATRHVSTIHGTADNYQVLLEFDPRKVGTAEQLDAVRFKAASGALIPLSSIATVQRTVGPRSISQLGQLPVATISFDVVAGTSLGQALDRVTAIKVREGVPSTVVTSFAGTARAFQDMVTNQPLLLAAAVLSIYIVLGILYESFVHPFTILAGLPAAAMGAVAALYYWQMDLSIMALIGILLLFGIVKKNAIMMVDAALSLQRGGATPAAAIREACLVRFRPIMMTTLVALAGAVPVAFGYGANASLHQPLGIAVVGGLVVSQIVTLFITPALYLYFDALSRRSRRLFGMSVPAFVPPVARDAGLPHHRNPELL